MAYGGDIVFNSKIFSATFERRPITPYPLPKKKETPGSRDLRDWSLFLDIPFFAEAGGIIITWQSNNFVCLEEFRQANLAVLGMQEQAYKYFMSFMQA